MQLFKVNRSFHIKKNSVSFSEKNTLCLYANDRLTAEQCIQHEAFVHLNRKHPHRQQHRPYLDKIESLVVFFIFD
jgi:hypothetical protein